MNFNDDVNNENYLRKLKLNHRILLCGAERGINNRAVTSLTALFIIPRELKN
jgi:hypothetical protein